ncbi:MAG: hypothetical protein ACOZNI_15240 [Myxococcota bacterium]
MPPRRELAVYVALAVLGVAPALAHPGATVGDGVDAFGTHWFYWWIRFCLERFGDPSHTPMFFFPDGKDVFAHTGNNFVDAVLSIPFQWVFGPTLYQPLFVVVILVGNALAFRPLARYVLGDDLAAFVATTLWQVNPFLLFEVTAGRPTQAFAWFVPIAVLYFLKSAREEGWGNPVRFGVAMGVAGWSYWYNGYFLALLFVVLAPFELRAAPSWRGALARWLVAAAVCAALVAPGAYLISRAHEAGVVPGLADTEGSIFTAPKPAGNNVSSELHGLWLMEAHGAPLFSQPAWGLPLLVALFWRKAQLPGGRAPWIVALLVVIAFALGPMIHLPGRPPAVSPWYMAAYRHLPFFNRLWFPYRMVVVAFVPATLLVTALVLRATRPKWVLAGLVAVGLAGQAVAGIFPFNWHHARAPEMLAELKGQGGAVMFLPLRIQHDGLMWQTEFQLPTFGGMGESAMIFWTKPFRDRLNNSYVRALRGAAMTPPLTAPPRAADRATFRKLGFRWIVLRVGLFEQEVERRIEDEQIALDVDRALAESVQALSVVVGRPPAGLDGDALLWDLDGRWQPSSPDARFDEARLRQREWRTNDRPKYETQLENLGRTGKVRERTDPKRPR